MPAVAPIGELREAQKALRGATNDTEKIEALRVWGPRIGWRNAAHMLFLGKTPEQLKAGRGAP